MSDEYMGIQEYLDKIKDESEERFNNFDIEEIGSKSIKYISDNAYLEKPVWLGGDNKYVCLFIDLDNSSKLSFKKHPATMAKIYDYFTQNIVNIMSEGGINADYIDIKGDGAFGIFEGENAVWKALCCAATFKTFFDKYIRKKFQTDSDIINCKMAIDIDKILVRKLGKKGDKNNNEVWAGRVVNNTAKISSLANEIYDKDAGINKNSRSLVIISDKIYSKLFEKQNYTIISCGCDGSGVKTNKANIWREYNCSDNNNVNCEKVYYTSTQWCDIHGDEYMSEILKKNN
ncbi:MAG: hypothetical protein WC831_01690 [Parcubacteria group bacterium]|jgi:class 3 adenylate cyclase